MILFSLATLTPVALIALGAVMGAPFVWLALGWMTVLTATLDALVRRVLPTSRGEEFPAADALSVVLALGQFGLVALTVRALAGDGLDWGERIALFLAAGLFLGQVGNANAHELIHRSGRFLHGLGVLAYVSVLFGHHASAHVLIHHVRAATPGDPNSARPGEGLYRFLPRAWAGSFREGFLAERARRRRRAGQGAGQWTGQGAIGNPYVLYLTGAALVVAGAAGLGGWRGVVWLLLLAGYAQMQILMADYVQHYGLAREVRADGRPEPVAMRHSWNSAHPASSALMLNAPRHSDHHAHPSRPYPALTLPPDAPLLPHSLPVMAVIALFPPLWRRIMDPRAARWRAGRI
ncbi:MAG: alkane 1-monooxygenase [Rubellimicrobium sp.]|nr:alkane 1-monooxygenase [Rubellimicrobium sp.]